MDGSAEGYTSRPFHISRIIPERAGDLFDADYLIASAIRNALNGVTTCINRTLLDRAFPNIWENLSNKKETVDEFQ